MEQHLLEAIDDILKALGAKEPFEKDYSAFTEEGLAAWEKYCDIMELSAWAGICDDDDFFDFKNGVKEHFRL